MPFRNVRHFRRTPLSYWLLCQKTLRLRPDPDKYQTCLIFVRYYTTNYVIIQQTQQRKLLIFWPSGGGQQLTHSHLSSPICVRADREVQDLIWERLTLPDNLCRISEPIEVVDKIFSAILGRGKSGINRPTLQEFYPVV